MILSTCRSRVLGWSHPEQQVCVGVLARQKQMKFLEQQQDETRQAREEARRLRGKMQTMER